MKYVDLSLSFTNETPVFPGDPSITIKPFLTVSKDGCSVHSYSFSGHTGTHIDAPSHFIEGGKTHADMPVDRYIGKGILIDARGKKHLGVELVQEVEIPADSIVIVWTNYMDESLDKVTFYEESPNMTEELAKVLVAKKIKIVGLDVPNPDREPYPVHKILLSHDIMIIEGLSNLDKLQGVKEFTIAAFPFKTPTDGVPVRVVAML